MASVSRREFLAGVSALALSRGLAHAAETAEAPKTNVLFIMTDQQRWDALSCAGNGVVETPHLDRLASQGVRFSEATCSSPLCGPSRASMLSGQYMHAHRCPGNAELARPGMPEEVETWEETLSAAGWSCNYHGKWHTGSANTAVYKNGLTYYLKDYHDYLAAKYPDREPQEGERVDRYSKWPYRPAAVEGMMREAQRRQLVLPHHPESGQHTAPAEDSLTAWTARQTVEFLSQPPDGPWSVTCSILHPHAPLIAASPYYERYDPARMPMPRILDDVFTPKGSSAIPEVLTLTPDGMGRYISLYYGLVREVDDWVGKIMDALEQSGQADRTLVVFTSDHGEMLGEHARVSKMVFYEASLRVPLLLRMPGRIPAGRTLESPATGADLAPTIFDYLGLAVPKRMHGKSLRSAIDGRAPAFEYAYSELVANRRRPNAQRIVRSPEWKFIVWQDRPLLYHLTEDPDETKNLLDPAHRSDKWVEQGKRLHEAMLNRLEAIGSPERDALAALTL